LKSRRKRAQEVTRVAGVEESERARKDSEESRREQAKTMKTVEESKKRQRVEEDEWRE
jgi:hypothetical protein